MDHLSKFLQENVLTLLVFDSTEGKMISSVVSPSYFDGDYAEIAKRSISYINQYNEAPKEHIADLFEDILEGDNTLKKSLYTKVLHRIRDNYDSINKEYVMDKLMAWIRHQELQLTIIECGKLIQENRGKDVTELVSEIEVRLQQGLKKQNAVFSSGTFLGADNSFGFLNAVEEAFGTGIAEFDKYNIGPARGELYVQIGLAGSGKTQALIHLAKSALLQRLKVCHISLEMSEDKMLGRYYQSLFSIPKRYIGPSSSNGKYYVSQFELDELHRVTGFDRVQLKPKMALEDPDIKKYLKGKLGILGAKMNNLVVKQFPDGSLTMSQLRAYLDGLENHHNFVPDLLILDYVDKMKVDATNLRHELSQLYVNLRGLGVERNFAVVTASQSNRAGTNSKMIDSSNVAEAWDKIAIADVVVTYSQTLQEKALGLARLFVSKNRNDMDGQIILIAQNYAFGQFCLKSMPMLSQDSYFSTVKRIAGEEGYVNDQET